MIGLLVTILIYVLVGGVVWMLIGMLGLDPKFTKVAQVILVLIFLLAEILLIRFWRNEPKLKTPSPTL